MSWMYIRPLPSRCPVYTNYILRLKLIQNDNEKSELILQFELLSGCYIWCVHGVESFPSFQGMYCNEDRSSTPTFQIELLLHARQNLCAFMWQQKATAHLASSLNLINSWEIGC